MIEGLKGAALLKEIATLAQNLEKKLSLPVSVEVLQKLSETKDGYKYLTNIDGKLTEAFAKKELEVGLKYWADGVKNHATNTLTLENMLQKPQILQSEIFKSETIIRALGFEKLVEAVRAELAKPTLQTNAAKTDAKIDAKTTAESLATQSAQTQLQAAKTEESKADMTAPGVIRLAAAEQKLGAGDVQATTAPKSAQATEQAAQKEGARETAKEQDKDVAKAVDSKIKTESQAAPERAVLGAKEAMQSAREAVLKEIKSALTTETAAHKESQKEEPKNVKTTQNESLQKSEAPKEPQATQATQRAFEKLSGETLRDKLAEFKNIMASIPSVPSKVELEKIKGDTQNIATQPQKEGKAPSSEASNEAIKAQSIEKLLFVLSQTFEALPQSALQEAAKRIADILFGKLPEFDKDEAVLKVLEHLQKRLEESRAKEGGKKVSGTFDGEATEVRESKEAQNEPLSEQTSQKTDNPASKLKAQLLEELAKTGSKQEFQILSNVAMALNREVFTFVLKDKGVLQFKKGGKGELNAKWIEFYSAFESLGPVSGTITHIDGKTSLALNVEFESTYNFLKENLKELSFFDRKNVSIMHGIKEIAEIKSSFLDTTG